MRWRAVSLEDEPTGKQLIAVLNEFGKKTAEICSVNFGFLIDDKMQSNQAILYK